MPMESPVVYGGIETSINKTGKNLDQARWKAHAIGPDRICLNCLGQYKSEDVSLEQSRLLEDQRYIDNLSLDHFIHHGENVFAFSVSVAGMEMQQFLSLILQPRRQYYGPKEFDFNSDNIDFNFPLVCRFTQYIGEGDKLNGHLIHPVAELKRKEVKKSYNLFTF